MLKKLSIYGLGVLTITTMALAPLSASASSGWQQRAERWHSMRCHAIDWRQAHLYQRFDQENSRLTQRIQNLVDRENNRGCRVEGDIVDSLVGNGNFKTLTAAVGAAGLVDTLKSPGKFTVFAPTDQAFAKLPAGTVEGLLGNVPTLQAILKYHVVAGEVPASIAKSLTSAPTANGQSVSMSIRNGQLYINDSRVVIYDIKTTNGVIHVIDSVLLPS